MRPARRPNGVRCGAASLTRKQLVQLNGATASIPKVYGVCGMAVGDLTGTSAPELVVGSMDGHLLVLSIDPLTGDFVLPPVYQEQVEGAIGLYNSIVIADLDAAVPGNELYVAGSMGLRKWVK